MGLPSTFYKVGFSDADLTLIVTNIVICGYPDEGGGANHWVVFLQVGPMRSVKVDMTLSADGVTGVILLSSKSYGYSDNFIVHVNIPTLNHPTVQDILDVITKNGRDRYKFSVNGEGCRHWIYVFICDLENASYIASGSAQQASYYLSKFWSGADTFREKPPVVGMFY